MKAGRLRDPLSLCTDTIVYTIYSVFGWGCYRFIVFC